MPFLNRYYRQTLIPTKPRAMMRLIDSHRDRPSIWRSPLPPPSTPPRCASILTSSDACRLFVAGAPPTACYEAELHSMAFAAQGLRFPRDLLSRSQMPTLNSSNASESPGVGVLHIHRFNLRPTELNLSNWLARIHILNYFIG